MIREVLAILILIWNISLLPAQSARVWADSNKVEIGNTLKLYVSTPTRTDSLLLTEWKAVMPPENVLSISNWQQVNGNWLAEASLLFFDSGTVVLPPLHIGSAYTDSLSIEVYPMALSDTTQLAPIKGIIEAPAATESSKWWIWTAIGLCLLVAFWLLNRWLKNRKSAIPNSLEPIPTDVWHKRFTALRQTIPAQPQKAYYAELSALLRNWIERNHRIPALERTTSEILLAIDQNQALKSNQDGIRNILETADLVKFASAEPDLSEQLRFWLLLEQIAKTEH